MTTPPTHTATNATSITEMLRLVVGPALDADPGSRLVSSVDPRRTRSMAVERWGPGDLERAVTWALDLGADVYFDTAPVSSDHVADLGSSERGRREQRARYVVALDLDHADAGGHQGDCLPSKAEAEELIAALPLRPSIVVDTGGGYHAYWLTEDPISDPGATARRGPRTGGSPTSTPSLRTGAWSSARLRRSASPAPGARRASRICRSKSCT